MGVEKEDGDPEDLPELEVQNLHTHKNTKMEKNIKKLYVYILIFQVFLSYIIKRSMSEYCEVLEYN